MGMVSVPAACAGCHRLGAWFSACMGCGLRYCPECKARLRTCPSCGSPLT